MTSPLKSETVLPSSPSVLIFALYFLFELLVARRFGVEVQLELVDVFLRLLDALVERLDALLQRYRLGAGLVVFDRAFHANSCRVPRWK